jgi:hypothetical protein
LFYSWGNSSSKNYFVNKYLYNELLTAILLGMSKQEAPLSIRLTHDMKKRLEDGAEALGISAHTLARLAIEAGIIAIENGEGRLAMPLEFEVTHMAVPKSGQISYPSHRPSHSLVEEKPKTKKSSAG